MRTSFREGYITAHMLPPVPMAEVSIGLGMGVQYHNGVEYVYNQSQLGNLYARLINVLYRYR